jgi:hypothetical protein
VFPWRVSFDGFLQPFPSRFVPGYSSDRVLQGKSFL